MPAPSPTSGPRPPFPTTTPDRKAVDFRAMRKRKQQEGGAPAWDGRTISLRGVSFRAAQPAARAPRPPDARPRRHRHRPLGPQHLHRARMGPRRRGPVPARAVGVRRRPDRRRLQGGRARRARRRREAPRRLLPLAHEDDGPQDARVAVRSVGRQRRRDVQSAGRVVSRQGRKARNNNGCF